MIDWVGLTAAVRQTMAEMVVIGAIVVLPIWILADAGSIKAPCQPEHRKERKPMQSVKAPAAGICEPMMCHR